MGRHGQQGAMHDWQKQSSSAHIRVGGVEEVHVCQQEKPVGPKNRGHVGGKSIVVAKAQLLHSDCVLMATAQRDYRDQNRSGTTSF
jgi:hypothetical protein